MGAREHIERRPTMAMQLAAKVADDIKRGRYAPGEILPSESQMVTMFDVGKATVRTAMEELRRMGLVETRQGKGTRVLPTGGVLPPTTLDRSVTRTSRGVWSLPRMTETEPPAVSRTSLDGPPAALLDQQDQDAISVDRSLHDPETGARMAHRMLIPLATAADVPSLAERPDAEPNEIYGQLADAGFTLSFTEHVTARIPYPDERSALGADDTSPLLITYRVTADAEAQRPLVCEELKAPAATCQLTFPVTPTKAPAKRAPRRQSRSV